MRRARRRGEGGFAILEVLISVSVLVVSLLAVSSLMVTQAASISSSTMQQVADGLLTQALDQVRAMPFQVIANGLSNSDSTVSTDSNISITGTSPNQTYTFVPTGETIPHSTVAYTQAPFVPHVSTPTVNGVKYTVSAYPTIAGTGTSSTSLTPLSQPANPPTGNSTCTLANQKPLSANANTESLIGNVSPSAGTEVAAGSWFSFITTDDSPIGSNITGYSDPTVVLDGTTTITPTVTLTTAAYASGINYADSNGGSTSTNCPYLVDFQIPSSLSLGSHEIVTTTYDSDGDHDTVFWPFTVGATSGSALSGDEYRVTVIVTWKSPSFPGLTKIEGQTLVYSPVSGCLSSSNVPLQASCPPLFYSASGAGAGSITVTAAPGWSGSPIANLAFNSIVLSLAGTTASTQVEQTASMLASAFTSGATLSLSSGSQSTGGIATNSSASNDPGITHSLTSTGSSSQSEVSLQGNGTGSPQNWISATPGSTDAGTSSTTATASTGAACDDLSGSAITNTQPCSSASMSESGTAATVNMGLYAGSSSLGTIALASVGAQPSAIPDRIFDSQWPTSGSSYCTSTSGNGCIHGAAQDAVGAVSLGALPTQFLTDGATPTGWGTGTSNRLLSLTNYSAQATAESGISPASPTAVVPASGQATPVLTYWNGSGYTNLNMTYGATAPSITIPQVSITDTHIGTGSVSVTMGATVTLGATTTSTSTPSGCTAACTATATASAPLTATVTYLVKQGSTTIADVQMVVVLGTLSVSTSYQAAT